MSRRSMSQYAADARALLEAARVGSLWEALVPAGVGLAVLVQMPEPPQDLRVCRLTSVAGVQLELEA